ncbi:hypothetical protein [Romboutsia ilealis]|uniref:hypothetical protein n=1 Tax=Romboutsia ilealis TaxID=1115758 RepID=UPI00272C5574|nr:hypothetical protein [Romboutsia ilealis]
MNARLKEIRESLADPNLQTVHAILDDIRLVADYIDTQTGDVSTISESNLVEAIKGLTTAVNELKLVIENHVEELPIIDIEE